MLVFSTIVYLILTAFFIQKKAVKVWARLLIFICGLAIISATSLEIISGRLTGLGFNEAVIFHMQYGFEGAGIAQYKSLILLSSIALLTLVITWAYFSLNLKNKNRPQTLLSSTALVAISSLCLSQHPTMKSIFRLLLPKNSNTPIVDFYIKPVAEEVPQNRPNIVWIYAESLERTYFDNNAFPGLVPNLRKLESESLSFSDIEQVGNSGWTIAGIVSSQCGIPLVVSGGHGNSMNSMPKFLPGAECLGDVLKKQLYSLNFMGGADTVFAGKGKFFKTHGFESVSGKAELLPLLADQDYQSDWGLYDDSLFDLARQKFDSLLTAKRPFGLFLMTLDTHHPAGYISKSCGETQYGDGSNTILNSVHCSDKIISEFITDIVEKNPNTLVVLASDHLAMQNSATEELIKLPRKNLLLFHWPERIKPSQNSRAGSTFSSGVTALNLMGFKTKGIGLGRDLLGSEPTLREAISNPQETVFGWEHEFRKLWNIPRNPDTIHVDPSRQFVSFSGSLYRIPLIVDISEEESFPRLIYDGDSTLSDVIKTLGPETRSIWLDSCAKVMAAINNDNGGEELRTCIWDDRLKKITHVDSPSDYQLTMKE